MKKIIYSLVLGTALLLSGCTDETVEDSKKQNEAQESVTIDSKVLESVNEEMKLNITIPELNGMDNLEEQKRLNDYFLDLGTELANSIKETEKDLNEADGNFHAEGSMSFEVTLHNEKYLSLVIDQYTYTGGAHGSPGKITFNYNFDTNKEIKLKDLFTDDTYVATLSQLVKENMLGSDYKDLVFEDFTSINKDELFVLTEEELILVFNPYQYTAGAAGTPEVKIDKSALPTLREEYK